MMKALVWEAPRMMALREKPNPTIEPNEVLVRVAFAGICGSELSGYLGHNALRVPPLIMGHEFSGEIVELGGQARTLNPRLAAGQPVTVNPLVSCGECEYCRAGLNQLCGSRKLLGAHRPGAYAEYIAVPAEVVTPLPSGMSLRIGALVEPVAVGVRIGEMAGRLNHETALVIGAGPIGLLALQTLLAQGAHRVFVSDLAAERLAMAYDLGAETLNPREVDVVKTVREATGGRGAAVTVDAVGASVTRAQAVAATRSAGTIILSGLHEESGPIPASDIIRREITLRGSFAYTPANFADGLGRLERGEIRLDPWMVEAPLGEGGPWFDRLIDAPGGVAKVLLVP